MTTQITTPITTLPRLVIAAAFLAACAPAPGTTQPRTAPEPEPTARADRPAAGEEQAGDSAAPGGGGAQRARAPRPYNRAPPSDRDR